MSRERNEVEDLNRALKEVIGSKADLTLKRLCSVLINLVQASTPEGGVVIYMFGLRLGERLADALPGSRGDALGILKEALIKLGLAEDLNFRRVGNKIFIEVSESAEAIKTGFLWGQGECNFTKGFIAGFLSKVWGKVVLVKGVRSKREGSCTFVVDRGGPVRESHPTRMVIVSYLSANPGAHLRQIARDLGMSMGTLRWHLSVLERNGLVWERREGNRTKFFLREFDFE